LIEIARREHGLPKTKHKATLQRYGAHMSVTPATEVVLYEVEDGVAVLTLNRPDRLNAWVPEMQVRYFDLLEEAAADGSVRAIVVTGAGRGFCAGADMEVLQGSATSEDARGDSRPQTFPTTIPKPVIAAVNGPAAGLGLVMALQCDIRFAAAGAKLTTAFARRGLIAEHGISWTLPRLVGSANALDLLFSGRVILAEEALAMGLVNAVHPAEELLDRTLAYARELATWSSPTSMAVMKKQVYEHMERGAAEALEESNRLMGESFERPDFAEGVAAFVERREPRFEGVTQRA
jgi:enoyl-CoA hydratase/carnithine racemase